MADGIYVSMCGAVARAEQLEAIADNLANGHTPGFKAARPAFEAFLPAGDKAYTAAVASGLDLRPGPLVQTGNPLDVTPEEGAFLAVRTASGEVAFTRDGRIQLDGERRLVVQGRPVLDRHGAPVLVPPEQVPEIQADGMVRAGDSLVAELQRVRLEGPVDRLGASLLRPGPGGRAVPSEAGLRPGELEEGNAPALGAAVAMIAAQRHFEASMQAIQTYRRMDERAAETGRVR